MKGRKRKRLQLPPLRQRLPLPIEASTPCPPVFRDSTFQLATAKLLHQQEPKLRVSPELSLACKDLNLRRTLVRRQLKTKTPRLQLPVVDDQQPLDNALVPVISKIVLPVATPQALRRHIPKQPDLHPQVPSKTQGMRLTKHSAETTPTNKWMEKLANRASRYKMLSPKPLKEDLFRTNSVMPLKGNRQVIYQKDHKDAHLFLMSDSSDSSLSSEFKPKL